MRKSQRVKKGTCCGMCGSDCHPEAIITCSNCEQVSEHLYCMEIQDSFQGKSWQCYVCQERDKQAQEAPKRPSLSPLGEEAISMPLKQHIFKEEPIDKPLSVAEFRNQQHNLSADISASGCCTSESSLQNSIQQMEVLISSDASLSTHHSSEIEWKGDFEILDAAFNLCGEVQAHFPGKVSPKAYDASKKLPRRLKFKLMPRPKIWPKCFRVEPPDCNDIALYFLSGNDDRSKENYMNLLDVINIEDIGLQSFLGGMELLIFSSNELPLDCQRLNGQMYMWGIFRQLRLEKIKTLSSYHCLSSSKKSASEIVSDGIFDSRQRSRKECELVKISGIADGTIILPSNATSGGADCQLRPPIKFELKKSTRSIDCAPGFPNFGNTRHEKKTSQDHRENARYGNNCKPDSFEKRVSLISGSEHSTYDHPPGFPNLPAERCSSWDRPNNSRDGINPGKVTYDGDGKRKGKWPSW